jgi:hypothetical protein
MYDHILGGDLEEAFLIWRRSTMGDEEEDNSHCVGGWVRVEKNVTHVISRRPTPPFWKVASTR